MDSIQFEDLKCRHEGQNVWVLGTGPSLDGVINSGLLETASLRGEPLIFINHAAEIFYSNKYKCPQYVVAADNETWRGFGRPPRGCISLIEKGFLDIWDTEAPDVAFNMRAAEGSEAVFCSYRSEHELPTDRDWVAREKMLYTCQGSGTPAAFLAWYMGAKWIHLVGVDGGHGHARAALGVYTAQQILKRNRTDYNIMLSSARRVLRLLQGNAWTHHTWKQGAANLRWPLADSRRRPGFGSSSLSISSRHCKPGWSSSDEKAYKAKD